MALTTVPASLSATALTLTTAAQPNITSVGTLTGLTVSGNIAGTLTTAAQTNITSVGTLTGLTLTGATSITTSSTPLSLDRTGGATAVLELKIGGSVKGYLGASGSNILSIFNSSAAEKFSVDGAGNATFVGTGTFAGGAANNNDDANILTLNASQHARLLVDTGSTSGHRATLALESNGNETTLSTTGSASFLNVDTGDLTIDIAGDIILDADGDGEIFLKDGGTSYGLFYNSNGNFMVYSAGQDKDIYIQGNDGGSTINALTFDMSEAGAAHFNTQVGIGSAPVTGYGHLQVRNGFGYINEDGSNTKQMYLRTNYDTGNPAIQVATAHDLLFATSNTTRMTIDSSGNVGIGTSSPAFGSGSGLEVSRSGTATVRVERTGSTASSGEFFAGNGKVVLSSISNNHLEFRVAGAQKVRFDTNGNVSVGSHGNTPTLTHKTNTSITASQSAAGTWSATSGEAGTYDNRGAIEVAGIYNKHFYKWAFTGNISAQTWYPFAKRSELTTAVNQTGSGSEDGFAMYFRIYTYLSTVGVGEYGANRLSNMIWIHNFGSNSNQVHYFNMGPALGHAPNLGDSGYGNAGPFRLRLQHRYGSDSNFAADQTFEIYSNSALTGLNPGVAGRQILIYGYLL